jgi:hypothetical protein
MKHLDRPEEYAKKIDQLYGRKMLEKYLKEVNELESVIAKGHAIVEHFLDRALREVVFNEKKYSDWQKLTFARKVDLLKLVAFTLPEELPSFLLSFNKLRNNIVHDLNRDNSNDVKAFLKNLDDYIYDGKSPWNKGTLVEKLKRSVGILVGMLNSFEHSAGILKRHFYHHILEQNERSKLKS